MLETIKQQLISDKKTGFIDIVISLAWSDKVSFEYIFNKTGLREDEVIKIMRKELKSNSFINWRKRVKGRKSKHRKLNELKND
tara:strand:+ start:445 stop:693 length:249 start_codon:yes stop_codon:yes gene_type:complete